jgi:hypothetical protein
MTFNTRHDVARAIGLLEAAAADMRRALDYSPGDWAWPSWQRQAQNRLLEVSASMDMGAFELPHPWDLRPHDDAGAAERRAYRAAFAVINRCAERLGGQGG